MAIRVDLQCNAELDADLEYQTHAWFDAVPRKGEVIQFRSAKDTMLHPRVVLGVNYIESEPNNFRVLVVVE